VIVLFVLIAEVLEGLTVFGNIVEAVERADKSRAPLNSARLLPAASKG